MNESKKGTYHFEVARVVSWRRSGIIFLIRIEQLFSSSWMMVMMMMITKKMIDFLTMLNSLLLLVTAL